MDPRILVNIQGPWLEPQPDYHVGRASIAVSVKQRSGVRPSAYLSVCLSVVSRLFSGICVAMTSSAKRGQRAFRSFSTDGQYTRSSEDLSPHCFESPYKVSK